MSSAGVVWTPRVKPFSVWTVPGNDYRKRVGRRIRRARQRKQWSQTRLAQAMSVADAQISRWETGRVMPSPRNLQRIGEALDVPAETFLMVSEDEDVDEPEPQAA